jgi:hypothetical protein
MERSSDESLADNVRKRLSNCGRHRTGSLTCGNQRVRVKAEGLQKSVGGFGSDKMRRVDGADRRVDDLTCMGALNLKGGTQ